MIRALLTDIEGTTTPIAFVKETLFPYALGALDGFLDAQGETPAVAALLAEVRALAPDAAPRDTLRAWMAADAKLTPLKTLQGMIWRAGFADGSLRGALYADVAPCLRAWHAAGTRLHVYSSGSAEAQRLLFGHSVAGDLTALFDGFFDTRTGAKREPASYARIAGETGHDAASILFLSDVVEELDAAAAAGLATCQLVRAEDGTRAGDRHRIAGGFEAVARGFALPLPA